MAKNFIILLERDSKTTIEVYYLPYFGHILLGMLSCPPSWIFVDMHDTSQVGSRNFLTEQRFICAIIARTVSVSDFNTG